MAVLFQSYWYYFLILSNKSVHRLLRHMCMYVHIYLWKQTHICLYMQAFWQFIQETGKTGCHWGGELGGWESEGGKWPNFTPYPVVSFAFLWIWLFSIMCRSTDFKITRVLKTVSRNIWIEVLYRNKIPQMLNDLSTSMICLRCNFYQI